MTGSISDKWTTPDMNVSTTTDMGLFEAFREPGWNTYYEGKESVAAVDINQAFVYFFTAVLALVMIVLVIGSKGREKWTTFLRVLFSLHTGVVIFVTLSGQTWQEAMVTSACEYVPVVPHSLSADIGVIVGLKSVNITLRGEFNESTGDLSGKIQYNEIFSFNKATDMEEAFEEARARGLPWVILYILEYFYVDHGGFIWCRAFRESGHFAYIMLWCAFAAWCVANLQVGFAVFRGACTFVLSGAMMVAACILYHALQPGFPLLIPFTDGYIALSYGWSFWLCLVSGSLTMISGLAVILLSWWYPLGTANVFLHDEQLEGLEEELAMKDEGPLDIGTPRTMRRLRSARSYSNPSFTDDLPPPYDDKQRLSIAEGLGGAPWVRGSRATQSLGPQKFVTIAEELGDKDRERKNSGNGKDWKVSDGQEGVDFETSKERVEFENGKDEERRRDSKIAENGIEMNFEARSDIKKSESAKEWMIYENSKERNFNAANDKHRRDFEHGKERNASTQNGKERLNAKETLNGSAIHETIDVDVHQSRYKHEDDANQQEKKHVENGDVVIGIDVEIGEERMGQIRSTPSIPESLGSSQDSSISDSYDFTVESETVSNAVSDAVLSEAQQSSLSQLDGTADSSTLDDTVSTSSGSSVQLKYSDEDGVSKAIISINERDGTASTLL